NNSSTVGGSVFLGGGPFGVTDAGFLSIVMGSGGDAVFVTNQTVWEDTAILLGDGNNTLIIDNSNFLGTATGSLPAAFTVVGGTGNDAIFIGNTSGAGQVTFGQNVLLDTGSAGSDAIFVANGSGDPVVIGGYLETFTGAGAASAQQNIFLGSAANL